MNIFGKRLTTALEIRGFRSTRGKMSELTKALGISRSAMHRYLHGEIFPSAPMLLEFSRRLNVTTDFLLGASDTIEADLVRESPMVSVAFLDNPEVVFSIPHGLIPSKYRHEQLFAAIAPGPFENALHQGEYLLFSKARMPLDTGAIYLVETTRGRRLAKLTPAPLRAPKLVRADFGENEIVEFDWKLIETESRRRRRGLFVVGMAIAKMNVAITASQAQFRMPGRG